MTASTTTSKIIKQARIFQWIFFKLNFFSLTDRPHMKNTTVYNNTFRPRVTINVKNVLISS